MNRYWDMRRNALACYFEQPADHYWDLHWQGQDGDIAMILKSHHDKIFVPLVRKYLRSGSRILEGGCGRGQIVAELADEGFAVTGVDSAGETVKNLNRIAPQLDIRQGDILQLSEFNSIFHGYISVGVIEHFVQGYSKALSEIYRVLTPGGYLFVSFPRMSLLRKVKKWFGLYQPLPAIRMTELAPLFYQYIYPEESVLADFERTGFELIESRTYAGLKGLKDEVGIAGALLQWLFDYSGSGLWLRAFRKMIDLACLPFAAHMRLYVLQKKTRQDPLL